MVCVMVISLVHDHRGILKKDNSIQEIRNVRDGRIQSVMHSVPYNVVETLARGMYDT